MDKPEALRLVDVPFALREGLWNTQADHVLLNLHMDSELLRVQRDALLLQLRRAETALRATDAYVGLADECKRLIAKVVGAA